MSDLTISMAVNGNTTLQLSTTELKNLPGKFEIIAFLIQYTVTEKIDLSSIQLIDPKGKLIPFVRNNDTKAQETFEAKVHLEIDPNFCKLAR